MNLLKQSRNNSTEYFIQMNNGIKEAFQDFEILETELILPFQEYKKDYQPILDLGFKIIFSVLLGINFLFLLSAILYVKEIYPEVTVHTSKAFMYILSLSNSLLFTLASSFGIAGITLIYITGIIEILFTEKGIEKILGDGLKTKVYENCIYKDGNIANLLMQNRSEYELNRYFNDFFISMNHIKEVSDIINSNKTSISIALMNLYIDERKSDFLKNVHIRSFNEEYTYISQMKNNSYFTIYESVDLDPILNTLNRYTNANLNDTFQSNCVQKSYDFITTKQKRCMTNYTYITSQNTYNKQGENVCINFYEWTSDKLADRFDKLPQKCSISDFNSVSEAVKTYIRNIRDYNSETNKILDELKIDINRLNNNFILSYNYLRRPVNMVNDEVFNFTNLIRKYISKNYLEMYNCSKLKYNFKKNTWNSTLKSF